MQFNPNRVIFHWVSCFMAKIRESTSSCHLILYFSGHLRQKQNCIYAAGTVCGALEALPVTSTQNSLFTKYVATSTIVTRDQTAESTISTDYMIATRSANRMRSSYEVSPSVTLCHAIRGLGSWPPYPFSVSPYLQ
jgi:hypothetical protein